MSHNNDESTNYYHNMELAQLIKSHGRVAAGLKHLPSRGGGGGDEL